MFLQEDHGKHLFFSLTNKYDDDIALLKKVNKRCKQMPTTETVRTDYRRKKKNEKSIWRKTDKPK